jgi:NAD(P)-dependent dehydrogenase (short-subunit alcohol dehydrogenase family)
MQKSILITGASSGIGEALAREFARRGYRLALIARRLERLEALGKELLAEGASQLTLRRLDVSDAAAIAPVIEDCGRELGGLDIVVANAGVAYMQRVGSGDTGQLVETIAVDLTGACLTVDAAVRHFRSRGQGQIVGITSVARYRGLPGFAAYSAAKEGLHRYLQALRLETRRERITVTELAPGYIDTPMNRGNPSRPFVIPVEKGAQRMANLIEKGVSYSTVPAMPWCVIGPLLKFVPGKLLASRS